MNGGCWPPELGAGGPGQPRAQGLMGTMARPGVRCGRGLGCSSQSRPEHRCQAGHKGAVFPAGGRMFAQVWEWGRLSAEGWGARDQGAGKQLLQEAGNAGRAAPRLDTVKVGHHLSATLWVVTTHFLLCLSQHCPSLTKEFWLGVVCLPLPPNASLATSLGCFPLPQASFLTGALSSLLPTLLPVIPGYLETLPPPQKGRQR